MGDREAPGRNALNPPVDHGLCATCAYRRRVVSGRGSEFVLCERAKTDPAFSRYPRLPVRTCPGHTERRSGAAEEDHAR